MAVLLCLRLSLNDSLIHCSRRDLNRTMSLPSAKKRLQFFRRANLKRRKTAPDNCVTARPGDDPISPFLESQEVVVDKDHSTVPSVHRRLSSTRRKLKKMLSQTTKLFSLATYRNDSVVFTSKGTREGLKRASEDASHAVAGPDGEALPAYVVDDFFKLHSAGGSAWQYSWQWEAHLDRWEDHKTHLSAADCTYCVYCRRLDMAGHERAPLYVAQSPPALSTRLSFDGDSTSEPRGSEDSRLSVIIQKCRRQPRRKKGKGVAPDETYDEPHQEMPISPQTQASGPRLDIPRACAPEAELVRCSISAKSIVTRQIPIPEVFSPSKDCTAFDLSDPSRLTGRPHEPSPLQGKRLSFPLIRKSQPPPAPELKPEQRRTPVPGSFRLEDPHVVSSKGQSFNRDPPSKRNTKATTVIQGGFPGSITLVPASSTTAQSAIKELLSQHQNAPSEAKLQKRKPLQRSSDPAPIALSTPPASRNISDPSQNGIVDVPEVTFGITGSLPARPIGPRRRTTGTTGSADRDTRVCILSDTTGSPLPACSTYVHPVERKDRKNEETRKRHWRGMLHWRSRTESEPED